MNDDDVDINWFANS